MQRLADGCRQALYATGRAFPSGSPYRSGDRALATRNTFRNDTYQRSTLAARAIISPLVLEFLRRYPDMHVDIVTEGKLVDVVGDGFDLGVRVAGLVPTDMIAVSLGRPQRHAVVGSPE